MSPFCKAGAAEQFSESETAASSIAAVNEAIRLYEAESDATVNKIAGGLNLGL